MHVQEHGQGHISCQSAEVVGVLAVGPKFDVLGHAVVDLEPAAQGLLFESLEEGQKGVSWGVAWEVCNDGRIMVGLSEAKGDLLM